MDWHFLIPPSDPHRTRNPKPFFVGRRRGRGLRLSFVYLSLFFQLRLLGLTLDTASKSSQQHVPATGPGTAFGLPIPAARVYVLDSFFIFFSADTSRSVPLCRCVCDSVHLSLMCLRLPEVCLPRLDAVFPPSVMSLPASNVCTASGFSHALLCSLTERLKFAYQYMMAQEKSDCVCLAG